MIYNKILISKLLFDDSGRLIEFLGNDPNVQIAKRQIESKIADITRKREEYKEKITFPMVEYISKFSLDYRK
jgi:hypothetical protein